MKKTHKRKLLFPLVTETNLDNTFVRAEQMDKALDYLCHYGVNLSAPMICLSNSVLAKHVLARIKMPNLPKHLRVDERPKQKSRLTKILDMLNFKSRQNKTK